MPTYPLTFPSIPVTMSSFRYMNLTPSNTSPFTGEMQVYRNQGAWWEGEITFKPMTREEARLVQSFLIDLDGKFGTFLYCDPDYDAGGMFGVGGTINVNGASQSGNSLTVDGMTISTNGILKKGDYFQIGTGSSARLYMATEDLDSDSAGEGTLYFKPRLRLSPPDNEPIVTGSPKGCFRLAENQSQWGADQSSVHTISISFRESI